jgi:hypothetical protein
MLQQQKWNDTRTVAYTSPEVVLEQPDMPTLGLHNLVFIDFGQVLLTYEARYRSSSNFDLLAIDFAHSVAKPPC